MSEQMVALFEGDPQGLGLRLLDRTRDPQIVRAVRCWFATQRRAELAGLDRDDDSPPVRLVRPEDGDDPTPDGTGK